LVGVVAFVESKIPGGIEADVAGTESDPEAFLEHVEGGYTGNEAGFQACVQNDAARILAEVEADAKT